MERATVDFLVKRLVAGNVLSAMALGEHLSAGAIGRELRDKGRDWLNENFGLVAAGPSFLELPAAEVASFVASDDNRGFKHNGGCVLGYNIIVVSNRR